MFMSQMSPTSSQPQIFRIAKRFKHERDELRLALQDEIERRQAAERVAEQLVRYAAAARSRHKLCPRVRLSRRRLQSSDRR
ncbi:MAG TPA: hypothetical protein VHW67_05705 [Solirubrobacteraceae bacterium]|jgi:TPP-dependent indolepyruvate ferredoxin oxidoreductase alpha subunit|nr:hypothetical protein [Solirubrobacteraceae bacterium]